MGRGGTEFSQAKKVFTFYPLYEGDCALCRSFSRAGDGSCPSRALGTLKLHFARFRRADFLPKVGTNRRDFRAPLQNEPIQQDQSPFPAPGGHQREPNARERRIHPCGDRAGAQVTFCSLSCLLSNGSSPQPDEIGAPAGLV